MKLLSGLALAGATLGQKQCPNNSCSGNGINEVFKLCREYYPDYISEPNKGKMIASKLLAA